MTCLRALTIILLSGLSTAAQAQEIPVAAQLRQLNGELLRLETHTRALGTRGESQDQAAAVLQEREASLRQLIRTNPAEAVRTALPETVLEQLRETFPSLAGHLERRGVWQGTLEHVILDDFEGKTSESQLVLQSGGSQLRVFLSDPDATDLKSGDVVEIEGVGVGDDVAALTAAAAPAQDLAATSCSTTGPQKVLVILVNFASAVLPGPVTPELVKGILFGNAYTSSASTPDWSVTDYWQQASDGKTSVDIAGSQVVGPYTLITDYASCDSNGIRAAAMGAADPYVNFQNYSRVVVVFPNTGVCTWAGLATLGCSSYSTGDGLNTTSMAWLRADQIASRSSGVRLFTHEMGHNLGMSHASSRAFSGEALGGVGVAGTLDEYGDKFSTMGLWNFGQYSAHHATNILKWLTLSTASTPYNVQVVENSGTYTIQNYEARPGGVKALRVRRGAGNNAWLWIEGRKNTGIYDSQLGSQVFTGALIHYEDGTNASKTHLLDFTPATAAFTDPALPVGSSWTDPYSNVKVSVTGGDASSLTVSVSYGTVQCTRAAPTVTLSPASVSVTQGSTASFTVSVKNHDSAGCTASAFDLKAVMPSAAWMGVPGVSTLNIAPGQQSSTTYKVTPPTTTAAGTYTAGVTAVNSAAPTFSASASAGVTVTVPNTKLTLSVSAGGRTRVSNPAATCTKNCSYGYPQSPAATVTLTASPDWGYSVSGWGGACSTAGTKSLCTVSMSGSKSVTVTFKRGK